MTYFIPSVCDPPLQPWFPYADEQSTNCCSDKLKWSPFVLKYDYTQAIAENAQHEPHWPWFFIGDTIPFDTQSTSALTIIPTSATGVSIGVELKKRVAN